jgi:Flp pilus assembly protein TadD
MALRKGIALTRQGRFEEAIAPLLQARGKVAEEYASEFNLALCYLGTGRYGQAISILNGLRSGTHDTAAVNNLLAQSYIGSREPEKALEALQRAAAQTPKDESLYAYVADSCTDHNEYGLGLRVVDLGLKHLPGSARLHYERAMFLARLDRLEEAKPEFGRASELAPGGDIAYLATVQEALYEEDFAKALRLVRGAIQAGHHDYQMLSLLGTILMHVGATPGEATFTEAREALEASVAAQPRYSTAQIALGKLYLMEGRTKDAVSHLETGRDLEPWNPSVYTSLATAYRRLGDREKARECLRILSTLLRSNTTTGTRNAP